MLLMLEQRSHSSKISADWPATVVHLPQSDWLSTSASSLLLFEYQPAGEAAAASALFVNLQNKLIPRRNSSDEPDPSACSAVPQNFDGQTVYSSRRFRSGTFAVAEIPLGAIQVKDDAGTHGSAVRLDPIQREHFAFGVRLDPNDQAPGLSIAGKGGPGEIQLPGPVCVRPSRSRQAASGEEPFA